MRLRRIVVAMASALALVACASTDSPRLIPTTSSTASPDTVADTASTSTTVMPAVDASDVVLEPIASALDAPVDVVWRGRDRTAYVVSQKGTVRPVRNDTVGSPVLDITDEVSTDGERGLLGLTFSENGSLAYTNHTDLDGSTVITEYPVSRNGDFDLESRRVLLTIEQPYANHNGGNVTIGPDGMLYIGMGDGGSANDPERRGLDLSSLLGKLLRIDPTPSGGRPYTVPTDNPFVEVEGARPEIWAIGLRNPWRFSFDAETGDIWIPDVGQALWEEINHATATNGTGAGRGLNFGWSAFEGTHRFNDDQPTDNVTMPIFEYEHTVEDGCSVSGGAVARDAAIPSLVGWYVHGDYCSGAVFALRTSPAVEWVKIGEVGAVSAVRAAPNGDLYVLDYANGTLLRIQPA